MLQYTLHTISLLAVGIGMVVLSIVVLWRRRTSEGRTAAFLMLAVAEWSLAYGFELGTADLASKILLAKLQYLGIVAAPTAWFWLSLQYAKQEKWLIPRNFALLFIEPLFILSLVWTNESHRLIWSSWFVENDGSFPILVLGHGPGFWVHLCYAYLMLVLGTSFVVRALIRFRELYRRQTTAMLVAAFAPWAGNFIYLLDLSFFNHLDLTPFGFAITCLAAAWGILSYRLMDLVPVARDAIIESMDDAVIVLDERKRIVDLNPAAREILGGISQNIIGEFAEHSFVELPDLAKCCVEMDEGRSEIALGERNSRKQFDLHVTPLYDRKGERTGRLAILRDITERKLMEEELRKHRENLEEQVRERTKELEKEISERRQAEGALKESEQRYRTLVEEARDIIITMDLGSGTLSSANDFGEQILGYKREDILHKVSFLELIHPDDHERMITTLAERISTDQRHPNFPFRLRKADGSYLEAEINGTIIRDSEGNPHSYLGVIRDITERKRAEAAIRESEEKYRTLFEESKDIIFITSPDGRFLDINPAGLELLGFSSKEELSQIDIPRDLYVNSAEREAFGRKIEEHGFVKDHELVMKKRGKDGEQVVMLVTAGTVLDEDGKLVATRGSARDITGQKQLEQQLLQAQKMESIGTLAGGIAHDFNNLLAGILGYASLVKTRLPEYHQAYKYAETIEKSATRAAELTAQLLGFARGGRYHVKPINLNSIVDETLGIIGRTFDKSIEIETNLHADLPTVEGDEGQVQQVLINLCMNAADAMPQRGKLAIETTIEMLTEEYVKIHMGAQAGPCVALSVSDNGVGMDKETQERIFEPFFTTKEEGKGTGLGLAMVYGVVKNHGGYVHVYSEPGLGTTFRIYLPISGQPEEIESSQSGAPQGNNELILVVDDEEHVRFFAKEVLEGNGYRVLLAADGADAISIYEERHSDISAVILDLVMPKMGGQETFLKMREHNPQVKSLLSTGYSQNGKAEEILKSGFVGFLQKPYQPNELLSKLRNVLDSKD